MAWDGYLKLAPSSKTFNLPDSDTLRNAVLHLGGYHEKTKQLEGPMNWKALLFAVLSLVLVTVYGLVIGAVPDFPLNQDKFGALILWVVGLFFGGWQLSKQKMVRSMTLRSLNKSLEPTTWKPLLYAVLLGLLPVAYNATVGWNASFPLAQVDFVSLIVYGVGILIGGWQTAKALYSSQGRIE